MAVDRGVSRVPTVSKGFFSAERVNITIDCGHCEHCSSYSLKNVSFMFVRLTEPIEIIKRSQQVVQQRFNHLG